MKACDQDIELCRNWLYLVFKLEYEAKTFEKFSHQARMWSRAFPLGFKLLNLGFPGKHSDEKRDWTLKGIILSRVSKGETPVDHNPAGGQIGLSRLRSAPQEGERLTSIPMFNVSVNIVMRCRTVKREQI